MSLIIASLLPLIVLSIFSVVLQVSNPIWAIIGAVLVIGVMTAYAVWQTMEGQVDTGINIPSFTFGLDETIGAILILTVVAVAVGIIGIRIFGSGFGETTVKYITLILTYVGIWMLFSLIAYPLIISITGLGTLIYLGLTIAYTIGVIQKLGEG